jgi:uncharacterized YigZ family protein
MEVNDLFRTLDQPSAEAVFKEKGSKFLAYAYPLSKQEEVEDILLSLKKAHPKARHWCYAWQIGVENPTYRYNDDGEPNNSAGKPIFGQIQSFDLTYVLVVVVRYFGGTKLGVGGLVTAYRSAAKMALENAVIVERTLMEKVSLQFDYVHMDKVMRIIKENDLDITSQTMELDCLFQILVRKNNLAFVLELFKNLRCVKIKKIK